MFSRLTSFVRGLGRDEANPTDAADDANEPGYEMDPRETLPLPTVDLRALDHEIQGRLARIRRTQGKP